jgi:hypothetical protein
MAAAAPERSKQLNALSLKLDKLADVGNVHK